MSLELFFDGKDKNVLDFYKELPFNVYEDIDVAVNNVKKNNVTSYYSPLSDLFKQKKIKSVIDIGCGGGWFANSLSYEFGSELDILGVDFNEVAIKHAIKISEKMKLSSRFATKNLFDLESLGKFDLISSLGVLHHTHDTIKALKNVIKLSKENSILLLGLYHKYGRRPFLDFVENLSGLSEKEKFEEYKKLHKLNDDKHLYSWFRDQVLHPHETQHTYKEINTFLSKNNFKIYKTSINNFKTIENHNEIYEMEKKLLDVGKERINNNKYYPGFFIIFAEKI